MTDYVKRDDAIAGLRNVDDVRHLKALPSADVVELRHAHWYNYKGEWCCSACDHCMEGYINKPIEMWCGMCGSRMDEDVCETCKHESDEWDSASCDGCTNADSNWERKVSIVKHSLAIYKDDGNWYCGACGKQVPDIHDYCNHCGTDLRGMEK